MRNSFCMLLLILGIAIFLFGKYTSNKAEQQESRIIQAEANQQGYRRPILGPVRRTAREGAAESAQERIGSAERTVAMSQVSASWLQGIGVVVIVAGVACLVFSCCRKKRH
jgi:cytochrome c-type biogenesis protein CcmH/NrfG